MKHINGRALLWTTVTIITIIVGIDVVQWLYEISPNCSEVQGRPNTWCDGDLNSILWLVFGIIQIISGIILSEDETHNIKYFSPRSEWFKYFFVIAWPFILIGLFVKVINFFGDQISTGKYKDFYK